MFAVKLLVIIIVLQTLHNSQCIPYRGLGSAGTYFGIMNGLMSLISKRTKTTDEVGPPNQQDSVSPIDVLNFDNIETDKNYAITCTIKSAICISLKVRVTDIIFESAWDNILMRNTVRTMLVCQKYIHIKTQNEKIPKWSYSFLRINYTPPPMQ